MSCTLFCIAMRLALRFPLLGAFFFFSDDDDTDDTDDTDLFLSSLQQRQVEREGYCIYILFIYNLNN